MTTVLLADSLGQSAAFIRAARLLQLFRAEHSIEVTNAQSLVESRQFVALRISDTCRPCCKVLLILYMLAYLLELPAHCWQSEDCDGDPNGSIPRSTLSGLLSRSVSHAFQMFCLSVLLVQDLTQRYALNFWSDWQRFRTAVAAFALLDNLIAMFNGYGLPPASIYWSPLLRPFVFLGHSISVQQFFREAIAAAFSKQVLDIILMQAVLICIWSWFGLLMFSHTDEGDAYFFDLEHSWRSLFTLFSTANFPDVMMPAYSKNRLAFIYFGTFLVISLFMFYNVLLAALFNAYKIQVKNDRQKETLRVTASLTVLFNVIAEASPMVSLSSDQVITREQWRKFWAAYCEQYGETAKTEESDQIFSMVTSDAEGISRDAWFNIGHHLLAGEALTPTVATSDHVLRIVSIMHFVVDIASAVSVGVSVVQSNEFLATGVYHWQTDHLAETFQLSCCALYVVEMVLRLVLQGCFTYSWRSYRNVMDAIMAVSLSGLEVGIMLGDRQSFIDNGGRMLRLLAIVRVARCERLLWRLTRLREALYTLFLLLGTFRKVASALFLTFYLFSTVGVQIFGGAITKDNAALKDLDFSVAGGTGYYTNNFNDFASGLVVLFELMVVNNWFVIAGGLAAVASHRIIGWLFCISFYMFVHVIVLNILVTSVVESFERIFAEDEEEPQQSPPVEDAAKSQKDLPEGTSSELPESVTPVPSPLALAARTSTKYKTMLDFDESRLLLGDAAEPEQPGSETQLEKLLKAPSRSKSSSGFEGFFATGFSRQWNQKQSI